MALTIVAKNLISRTARKNITGGKPRKLNFNFQFSSQPSKGKGGAGIINKIFDFGKQLVGFLGNIFKGISFSASAIFGWLVNTATQLSQFDWNATDKALEQQIKARNIALAQTWGGAIGGSFGYLVAIGLGVGVSYMIPVFGGAALARAVASGATTETLEEIGAYVGNAVRATVGTVATNLTTKAYMGLRRWIKGQDQGTLTKIFGANTANWIKNVWGSEGAPRLTIADQIENATEKVPGNEYVKAFFKGFVEEAFEGFIEGGFLIASEIDLQIQMMKAANQGVLGQTRTIAVKPDRDSSERLLLTGPEQLIRVEAQSLINQSRMLYNKDLGTFVGEPAQQNERAKPTDRIIRIIFKAKSEPPWNELKSNRSVRVREMTCRISDVKAGVSWQDIKKAAKPYNWGDLRMTAKLDNGRQIALYGASEGDCTGKLDDLLRLTTAKVLRVSFSQKSYTKSDPDEKKLRKTAIRMYPAYVAVCKRVKAKAGEPGRTIAGETYVEDWQKYPLYTTAAPDNFFF